MSCKLNVQQRINRMQKFPRWLINTRESCRTEQIRGMLYTAVFGVIPKL